MENKSKLYFIVGTDTNVGKTFITSKLIKEELKKGSKTSVLKPVETGFEIFEDLKKSDSGIYADILNKKIEDINLYFLKKPLSPFNAAEKENIKIDMQKIKRRIEEEIEKNDIVYVEGAGGLLVPYTDEETYLDLIKYFSSIAKVIIISKNILGTINHTLLTVYALKTNNINIEKIILNNIEKIEDTKFLNANAETIFKMSGIKTISEF